ncbi:MAG: Crp/Fnr family transcriptional regulator [Thermodesulfobacteriota bacterium]
MECPCRKMAEGLEVSPACIGGLWLFESITLAELEALAGQAVRRRFRAGEYIFRQGDPANHMFLIKAGRVKLAKVTEEGQEITLDIRQAGDFLGENIVNEDEAFPVSAVCLAETLTCGFTKAGFENLVLAHPRIGLQVIKNLSQRIDRLTSRLGSMSLTVLEERLYQVLVNVAREHGIAVKKGRAIAFPLTHEELSFLVGAHRVSITRAMKSLSETGRVIRDGRTLIVTGAGRDLIPDRP